MMLTTTVMNKIIAGLLKLRQFAGPYFKRKEI